jgi:hypothetical protein
MTPKQRIMAALANRPSGPTPESPTHGQPPAAPQPAPAGEQVTPVAFIAQAAAELFSEAIAEAETGFRPSPGHLAMARRVSEELSAIRRKGKIAALANAMAYPVLLHFLFRTYSAFQNTPIAAEPTPETANG